MKKLLGIVVLGLLWCNSAYAEEIVLSCESKTWRDKIIYTDEYRRTFTYIIIPEEKIWKYIDGEEARLIIHDNYYVTYEIHIPTSDVFNSLFIKYITINRYDGGLFYTHVRSIPDDDRYNKYKNKKYNYKTFLELKQYVLYLIRNKPEDFVQSSGTCKPAKEKL